MNKQFRRAALGAGVTAALALASTTASALPDFTVDATGYGGSEFEADKIIGNYTELLTFNADNTFDVSILWDADAFVADEGTNSVFGTGLNNSYNIYALFQGSGTFVTVGEETSFSLTSGNLDLYIDPVSGLTTFNAPASGAAPWTTSNSADDALLATGSVISGEGRVECIDANVNCGSFGQTTTFALTSPVGTDFFIAPVPFFNVSFQSGQFNGFNVIAGTTITVQGSMDAWFAQVPEPGTLALMGAGILLLGVSTRRKSA